MKTVVITIFSALILFTLLFVYSACVLQRRCENYEMFVDIYRYAAEQTGKTNSERRSIELALVENLMERGFLPKNGREIYTAWREANFS